MKLRLKKSKNRSTRITLFPAIILAILILYAIVLFSLLGYAIFVATRSPKTSDFAGTYLMMQNKDFYFNLFDIFSLVRISQSSGSEIGLAEVLGNSLIYSIGSAFVKTLVPCLAAYACARFEFKTSKIVYTAVLVAMMIPIVGSLPSELKLAYSLGLVNSMPGVILLKANMLGLYFFVMYGSFKSMPNALFEAAKIDGASNLHILIRIAFPLIRNVFLTVLLINFVTFWNDYQTPMVYLLDKPTLGYVLWQLIAGGGVPGDSSLKTGVYALNMVILSSAPVVILFAIFKDKFMGNLTMGGIKG